MIQNQNGNSIVQISSGGNTRQVAINNPKPYQVVGQALTESMAGVISHVFTAALPEYQSDLKKFADAMKTVNTPMHVHLFLLDLSQIATMVNHMIADPLQHLKVYDGAVIADACFGDADTDK